MEGHNNQVSAQKGAERAEKVRAADRQSSEDVAPAQQRKKLEGKFGIKWMKRNLEQGANPVF